MKNRWLLLLGILAFSALVAYRAVVIPFTHDEASTWLNFRHFSMWACRSDYFCWQTANNHWLNTLLLQCSGNLFGEEPWMLRLPNVLAGALYFLAAALLVNRYIKMPVLQLAGFLLLSSHVYLLDFFSLARGYGLAACGVLWGVYGLVRYTEQYELRWLMAGVISMFLAVLSNFTSLLPMFSLALCWFVWLVRHKKYSLLFRHGVVWAMAAAVLAPLLYYPIRTLRGSGEFEWGSKDLWSMINDLVQNLLYGMDYFGAHSGLLMTWFLVLVIVLMSLFVLVSKRAKAYLGLGFLLLLLGINLISIVLLMYATGSLAPIGRKSVYLIPVLFAPLAISLNLITGRTLAYISSVVISAAMVYHLIHPLSPRSVREWYYDAYYPELFSAVLPDHHTVDTVRLGSSWIFYPSLSFYQKTRSLPVSGLAYQRPIVPDSSMHYYFIEAADSVGLGPAGFVKDKQIGPFYLFKNNIVAPSPTK